MGTKQAILTALKALEEKDPDCHFEGLVEEAIGNALCAEVTETDADSSETVCHEVLDDPDWSQDHKYQGCDGVIKITIGEPLADTNQVFYVKFSQMRSGSYHTDWFYQCVAFREVTPKEITETITRTIWEDV